MQAESRVSKDLRSALEGAYPGSLWLKMHGSVYMRAGISDILGCVMGCFIAIEVKIKGNTTTPSQEVFLKDVLDSGGVAIVYTHTPQLPIPLDYHFMMIIDDTLDHDGIKYGWKINRIFNEMRRVSDG